MSTKILRTILLFCFTILIAHSTVIQSKASRVNSIAQKNPTAAGPFEFVGHVGGSSYVVKIYDHYAFMGIGPELVVLDLSNPNSPTLAGSLLLPDLLWDIAFSYPYAYIADYRAGLIIINIADISSMSIVGSIPGPTWSFSIAVNGNYAYMGSSVQDMRVYDVSNPSQPVFLETLLLTAHDIGVYGSYAYVASGSDGFYILSLADPAAPTILSHYTTDWVNSISIGYPVLYAGRIYDMSDPANPISVGFPEFFTPTGISKVIVDGDYLYAIATNCMTDGCIGYVAVDGIRNPISFPGLPIDLAVYGKYVIVANGEFGGVRIFNFKNRKVPVEVYHYQSPGDVLDLDITDNYLYALDLYGGVRVIDKTNPANPFSVGLAVTPARKRNIAVYNKYAYVSEDYGGLRVVDISTPYNPYEVGFNSSISEAGGLIARGSYVYMSGNHEFLIEDVTNPALPVTVGSSSVIAGRTIRLRDNYAYLASSNGLRIMDISNPFAPTSVAFVPTDLGANDVELQGNYAYITGLYVIDISDPTNPFIAHSNQGDSTGNDIYVDNQYIYLATDFGVTLLDITDPVNPVKVGSYSLPDSAKKVVAKNGYIYVADNQGGIYVLRLVYSSITGRVSDFFGRPISSILLKTNTNASTTTDVNGDFSFGNIVGGDYTITPQMAGFVFFPASRTVTIPPQAAGENFKVLPGPVLATLIPGTATVLSFTDLQGLMTQVTIPANAVTETLSLTLIPTMTVSAGGLGFTGHAFEMIVSREGTPLDNFGFNTPITITIQYSDSDVGIITDEAELSLLWTLGSQWINAAQSCESESIYSRDLGNNILTVQVCRSGKFGMFGPTITMNLPFLLNH